MLILLSLKMDRMVGYTVLTKMAKLPEEIVQLIIHYQK
jgi:hypothetical protein